MIIALKILAQTLHRVGTPPGTWRQTKGFSQGGGPEHTGLLRRPSAAEVVHLAPTAYPCTV